MGESLLLLTIVTLVILAIRRAKPVVLENSVTIHRPGQYHMMLAPQLNRAQTFIEQIAKQFLLSHPPKGDLPSQYYEICDPAVFAKGASAYLLAVTLCDGMLYFQAINPPSPLEDADGHIKALREFFEQAMKQYPHSEYADEQWAEKLCDSVYATAGRLKIAVKALHATGVI